MAVEHWSDNITVARLSDGPAFNDDIASLCARAPSADFILDLASVTTLGSSNLSGLIRVRRRIVEGERRLLICGVSDALWGTFLVTGLDKVFDFKPDIATAIATLQLQNSRRP